MFRPTHLIFGITLSLASAQANPDILPVIHQLGGTTSQLPGSRSWEVGFHVNGKGLDDQGLAMVGYLEPVVRLNLRNTRVSSAGMEHVAKLDELRHLHLEGTSVDDAGLKYIAQCTYLRYLNLYGTAITDEGLKHLIALRNLQHLYLWQTAVTDEGVACLQRALPQLLIYRGADLETVRRIDKESGVTPLAQLTWHPATEKTPPISKGGSFTTVTFVNRRPDKVKLFWIAYGDGSRTHYGDIDGYGERPQNTYANSTWLITDEQGHALGYFMTNKEVAIATIPKAQ